MAPENEAVEILKAIADATRLRILGLLAASPRSGRELADALELSAPTVSHHMKRLEEAGVVVATPEANRRIYRLNEKLLGEEPPRHPPIEDAYQAKTVRTFFDGPRLKSIPAKRRARVAVLLELLRGFSAGVDYTEPQVNEILRASHPDVAFLRRELVDYGYLARQGGVYRVVDRLPERSASERQEVPAGEGDWLRGLIRATALGGSGETGVRP